MRNRSAKDKKPPVRRTHDTFFTKHQRLTAWMAVIALILLAIALQRYSTYLGKFSDRDYMRIENAADKVMRAAGANTISRYEHCRYRAPEEYSSIRLYCSVQMATYLPYKSDQYAISVAKKLEKEISKLGTISSYFDSFYQKPNDSMSDVTVIGEVFNGEQCLFTIASNEKAQSAATLLPKRTENDLIAIVFDCGAESREEYFPVTYRQG